MRTIPRLAAVTMAAVMTLSPLPIFANGLGEGRPYQFRTDSERQVALSVERTRLELLGLLGGGGGLGGGSGQTGNISSITVNGSNNNITVTQDNSGDQTQTSTCSDFNITGGMFGVC